MLFKNKNQICISKVSAWEVGSIIIALLFISSCSWLCPNPTQTIITRDSIITEIRKDTLIIYSKPELHFTSDTIIQTRPFLWQIDTIIKRVYYNKTIYDTLKIMYSFPDNKFQYQSKSSLDTLWKHYERIQTTEIQKLSWFEKLEYGLIYFIFGIIITVTGYVFVRFFK